MVFHKMILTKLFNIVILLLVFAKQMRADEYTVLIDPGHGGEDNGATAIVGERVINKKKFADYVFEKNFTLEISQLVQAKLKDKKYKAYLTRSFDRTVTLQERAAMAEKLNPDLIISIHINSSESKASHGIETYYLDNHSDLVVKKVEEIENKNLTGEDLVVQQIIIDLVIERTGKSSQRLSNFVHNEIIKKIGRNYKMTDRGARPGLFYVLALSKRPGILLEAGFMSNPEELAKMSSKKFKDDYANAIVAGIDRYFFGGPSSSLPLL